VAARAAMSFTPAYRHHGAAFCRAFAAELLLVVMINALIAVFLFLLTDIDLRTNFIFSQSIGLSIFLSVHALAYLRAARQKQVHVHVFAVPLGSVSGVLIGSALAGISLPDLLAQHPKIVVVSFSAALVFGTVVSYYFYSRGALLHSQAALQEENLKRLEQAQRLAHTELKLLQAQVEPHFLFNTLSNVASLIETDPRGARRMLEHFTDYLRAGLQRTREQPTTLADELAVITAYLEIQAIRMGARLQFGVDVPDELHALALPPLLIQPLVENAVKHGLEPKIEGGRVDIVARRVDDALIIDVTDDGLGLRAESNPGVGLNNVRERLRALYGERGRLVIRDQTSGGANVSVTLPLATTPRT
jgi:signal transduction histidine kinase